MVDTNFLASIHMFSMLSPADLKALADNFTLIEKNENDIIFKKGDPGLSIYIIQEGNIKITTHAIDGDELILAVLHKGDFFGEMTMFDQATRTANAIVYDHAVILEMSRKNFINLIKAHPDIAISMLGELGKRLRQTNEITARQVSRNVNEIMETELSFGERVSDLCAEFIGSWTFIFLFGLLLFGWMGLNIYAVFFAPVDPYPFILLNLMLSCLAAIQAPLIMMSQGRHAKKDKIAADLDYRVNLKAELQIQEIRMLLDKIIKQQAKTMKEIKHEQVEIIKTQQLIVEKLGGDH